MTCHCMSGLVLGMRWGLSVYNAGGFCTKEIKEIVG